jgi:hypothetical protein
MVCLPKKMGKSYNGYFSGRVNCNIRVFDKDYSQCYILLGDAIHTLAFTRKISLKNEEQL